MTIISIHQPGYLPWLGFFKKMMQSEVFVFLDDVQYQRKDTYNKNLIRTHSGFTYLTVPVYEHKEILLNEIKIDNTQNWTKKHKKSILINYQKTPFFDEHREFIENLYEKNFDLLIDLNVVIIKYVMNQLKMNPKILFSSELKIKDKGSDKVLNICKKLNANQYISGTVWAKDNLQIDDFSKNGIEIKFQNFLHPIYKQIHGDFIPKMSIIDLLFNEGNAKSKEILLNSSTI